MVRCRRLWRRRFAAGILLALTVTLNGPASLADDVGLYLYQIPSGSADAGIAGNGDGLLVDLFVPDPVAMGEIIAAIRSIDVVSVDAESIRVRLTEAANVVGGGTDALEEPTFVVDYDHPSVKGLATRMVSDHGANMGLAEIVEFVDRSIPTKSYRRGFEIASQVARSAEGDCTEHAVLLTALARARGRPAQLVFGVLVLVGQEGLQAFGHAWSEVHDGQAWRIADATRPEHALPKAQLYYVPLRAMRNEGPGYAMDLMRVAALQPSRIRRVAAGAPVDPGLAE